jgi:hypothetical protein
MDGNWIRLFIMEKDPIPLKKNEKKSKMFFSVNKQLFYFFILK